jgi:1-acyl-sn-glycerol-3-phosphate acyltransferase
VIAGADRTVGSLTPVTDRKQQRKERRHRRRDTLIRQIASFFVVLLYRKVEVYRAPGSDVSGAELSVSNHFGGFADPLLLVHALPRRPRIIARDVIWKIPVVGWIMKWLGSIPVHKPADTKKGDEGAADRNDQMFASCYRGLADGNHLLIFPEGETVDDPSIMKIKTGAARIALGARASGVDGIAITPAGIHYEDKAALRSDVFVNIGEPLWVDEWVTAHVESGADAGPSNRPVVSALTEDIEQRLRGVAPDFADWHEARTLTFAAEVLLRSRQEDPSDEVSISQRDRIAGMLGQSPPEEKQPVMEEAEAYSRQIDELSMSDRQVMAQITLGKYVWNLVKSLLIGLVLLPFAIVGVLVNWIPYLLVKAIGLLPVSPAVKATLKPMGAIVFFGITWGLSAWSISRFIGEYAWGYLLLMPLYITAVILISERAVLLWRAFRRWWRRGDVSDAWESLQAQRKRVIAAVAAAL